MAHVFLAADRVLKASIEAVAAAASQDPSRAPPPPQLLVLRDFAEHVVNLAKSNVEVSPLMSLNAEEFMSVRMFF